MIEECLKETNWDIYEKNGFVDFIMIKGEKRGQTLYIPQSHSID